MNLLELFLIALGLSMDAFAVSICKGLSVERVKAGHVLTTGAYFGGFQALMPLIGYFVGRQFQLLITNYDHWVAFVLLALIGANMIRESGGCSDSVKADFGFKSMFPLAVATSIDALVIGVTFAFLNVSIVPAVCFIGVITFALSGVGLKVGNIFGEKYKSKAEFAGGLLLILMGVKVLAQHLIEG